MSSICGRNPHQSAFTALFPNRDLLPGSNFPRMQLIRWLVIVSLCLCIYTQDFQLRVHPGPLRLLLCAYRGSRSVRVQVAHGREWWPGSRLATPVSIWCWQFTQAFFSTVAGRITHSFPSQRAVSPGLGAKNARAHYSRDVALKCFKMLSWLTTRGDSCINFHWLPRGVDSFSFLMSWFMTPYTGG